MLRAQDLPPRVVMQHRRTFRACHLVRPRSGEAPGPGKTIKAARRLSQPTRVEGQGVTMSRQSVAKAHQKIQELSWEPLYHEPVSQYGTDYTFQKADKKDPLKQVLRSYFPMQEEKDHRVYGAQDGARSEEHTSELQ